MAKKAKKVPVRKANCEQFLELKALFDNSNSAFDKSKKSAEKRKKYRIYRMVIVTEFWATEIQAQRNVNHLHAMCNDKDVIYWLEEVLPKRQKPPRCK